MMITTRVLWHGTTLNRANSIIQTGPNPLFREPGGMDRADGFSTSDPHGPYPVGSPEDYARAKAALFPNEGGPVIVEVEVPTDVVVLALATGGEIRFQAGFGLDELLGCWGSLVRRVVIL
jgi:hypothetical protein